jgi:propionyl-CoA synthetase
MHKQEEANKRSLQDPRSDYWTQHADQITWYKKPQTTISTWTKKLPSGNSHLTWQWFPDGELNTCYNCVDRHVERGNGDQPAIFWHSEVAQTKQTITYSQLKTEVETLAGVLRGLGVGKGDSVVIYIPMIPAGMIAALATARLGALHAVVFGGFGSNALAQRIDSANPKVVLTSSCGIESTSKIIDYQPMVRNALKMCKTAKPSHVLVWNRPQHQWPGGIDSSRGEIDWEAAVSEAKKNGVKADCVPVKSEDGLYILYTSGTTGAPKGVVRQNGGHAIGVLLSTRASACIHGPGDVVMGISDIGWVTGHTYVMYGPLLAGAASVVYEGKPIGTPDAGILWRLIREYKVNTMFTAPTALRAIRRADPDLEFLHKVGKEGGLRSLRALWLTGERSQPGIIET